MQYLLVGNYGVGNLGDEALRSYFLAHLPEVRWKVVSAHPQEGELPRFPGGIRSLFSFRWLKTFRALRKSDGMVLGGGSLFTDAESSYACVLWWVHVFFARLLRKKVYFAFQGVGPFRTRLGRWCARSAFRSAAHISVRDPLSLKRVEQWNTRVAPVESFDPVFAAVQKPGVDLHAEQVLIVIPRNNSGAEFRKRMDFLLSSDRFSEVRILSLKPDDSAEWEYCQSLRSGLSVPGVLVRIRTLHDLETEISRGSFVLTQRYHGALVALALGRELEVLPQAEGDKLDALDAILKGAPAHGRKDRLHTLVSAGEQTLKEVL